MAADVSHWDVLGRNMEPQAWAHQSGPTGRLTRPMIGPSSRAPEPGRHRSTVGQVGPFFKVALPLRRFRDEDCDGPRWKHASVLSKPVGRRDRETCPPSPGHHPFGTGEAKASAGAPFISKGGFVSSDQRFPRNWSQTARAGLGVRSDFAKPNASNQPRVPISPACPCKSRVGA